MIAGVGGCSEVATVELSWGGAMRLGCGANQEAIANVTRTRCDRRAVEAE